MGTARTPVRAHVLALVLVAQGAAGPACGGAQSPAKGSTAAQLELIVHSDQETNQGLPFRMLVRTVDLKTYVEESYADVASKVMSPDDSILGSVVIFPGKQARVPVDRPANAPLGVYFLFTRPGDPWKLRIERQDVVEVNLYLGTNHVVEPGIGAALGKE